MNRTTLRRVALAAAGFFIVVVIIAAIAGGDEDDSTPVPATASTSSATEQQEQTHQELQAQEQAQQLSLQQEQTQEQAQQQSSRTTPAPQPTREMTIDEYAAWCYMFGRVAATETAYDYTDTYFQHLQVLRRVPSELMQFHLARADIMVTMATFLEGDYDPGRAPDTRSPILEFEAAVEDLRPTTRVALKEAGCAY